MGAWIETYIAVIIKIIKALSHPYMGAWIETFDMKGIYIPIVCQVAPLHGCVD